MGKKKNKTKNPKQNHINISNCMRVSFSYYPFILNFETPRDLFWLFTI